MINYKQIAEKITGKKIGHYDSPGATDGRYFCEKGILCIIIQPNGGGMHSDFEWIERGGMEKLTQINLQFLRENALIE